ncbi:hypothetical protein [Methylophilus sp. Leaf414]|uniref:hypothetical protein n=1 Tax=Methylophilus sp. Leaf414 TaxID=1736371 RepID=UPI0006FBB5EC|nr:hypothetical protein [Methylophilus sp. Leaf414]KQT37678.1 hypothetical protein ASG24_01395 [Methylophilus sp. Leaf414]
MKKTQETVQTSGLTQDAMKEKLIAYGITDASHLEIITDEFAGQGGSFMIDESGKRTRID